MDTNLRNDLKVESSKVRNTDTAYQKPVLQSTDNSKGTHSIRSDSMLPNVQTILSTVHSIDNQTPVLNSTVHVNNPVTVQKPSYRRNIPLPVQTSDSVKRLHSSFFDLSYSLDVVEYEQDYRLYMDIPTVPKDSLQVLLQNEGIRIEGHRSLNYKDSKRVLFKKRLSGHFKIFIPCNIKLFDITGAKALYDNGELCILLRKRTQKRDMCSREPGLSADSKSSGGDPVSIQQIYAISPPKRFAPAQSMSV